MADVAAAKISSLAENYLVEEKEKIYDAVDKSIEKVKNTSPSEIVEKVEGIATAVVGGKDASPHSAADQESNESDESEIKLETAPADYRFPTTNQSRHCFTRYIEYHRCVAARGEEASECGKFAKYYRSLCPGEWVDRWNEQRENGTFPGPL